MSIQLINPFLFHKLTFAWSSKSENMYNPVMLDAPVSGGVPGAEAGTLTFMV